MPPKLKEPDLFDEKDDEPLEDLDWLDKLEKLPDWLEDSESPLKMPELEEEYDED